MAGTGIHPYHQQWPPTAVPPPPPPTPMDNSNRLAIDKVRTIFISGLPPDVKERELQNLLRWLPGYEASQVNFKGEHPMGFALLSTPQLAISAKDALRELLLIQMHMTRVNVCELVVTIRTQLIQVHLLFILLRHRFGDHMGVWLQLPHHVIHMQVILLLLLLYLLLLLLLLLFRLQAVMYSSEH